MQAPKTSISKMEAMRQALATLGSDAMPVKLQEYVQQTFGMAMSTAHVSNYKTAILRAKKKKPAGPKTTASEPAVSSAPVATSAPAVKGGAISLQDVETVKGLVGRVGEKNLKSLIDLLG